MRICIGDGILDSLVYRERYLFPQPTYHHQTRKMQDYVLCEQNLAFFSYVSLYGVDVPSYVYDEATIIKIIVGETAS